MESKYVQFNGLKWRVDLLGEEVLLLTAKQSTPKIVRDSSTRIEKLLGQQLSDITTGYDSIALFSTISISALEGILLQDKEHSFTVQKNQKLKEIPICYELGDDLEEVANKINLTPNELIRLHLQPEYEVAMVGFLPGFVYAEGLKDELRCPRKTTPKTEVLAGSVGIGGAQTGIYSFNSPGGWNIIGRTPLQLFIPTQTPPIRLPEGSKFKFVRISKDQFKQWEG